MAQKEVVFSVKVDGFKKVFDETDEFQKAIDSLRDSFSAPIKPEIDPTDFDKGLEILEAQTAEFQKQLKAVDNLGFGKALSQGFLKTKDDIVSIAQVLEQQLAATEPGAVYEGISKNLQAAQKELDKFAKAETKALADEAKAQKAAEKAAKEASAAALKESLDKQGFAKSFADGTIKSLKDVEDAFNHLKKTRPLEDKDFLDAQAALKVFGNQLSQTGGDANDFFVAFQNNFKTVNEETGEATLNVEALQSAYQDLTPAIEAVEVAVHELDLQFDNLSLEALESSIGDFSVTQIEKEIEGLQAKLADLGNEAVGSQAFNELIAKIDIAKNELEEKLLPAFADLSETEIKLEIDNASVKRLKKQEEDLQNTFEKLKPNTKAYDETLKKLKLVKGALLQVEQQTEVIKDIDIFQGKLDVLTKSAEAVNNLTASVGAFGGATKEATEIGAQYEKFLQGLSIIQSITDAVKGYQEAQKGASLTTFTTTGALKLFKFALAATGIGAIVLVVATLISQFGGLKKVLGIVSDAFAAASDAFQSLTKNLKFDDILKSIQEAGKLVFQALTEPYAAAGQFIADVLSGENIADSFKKAADRAVKPFVDGFNKAKGVLSKVGEQLSDSFNKSFDTRQKLRENERQKLIIESANANRAARKTALEAELADVTLNEKQKLAKIRESVKLEQQSLAASIANNKEKINLLTALGAGATEEQIDELRELKKETVQQDADLYALKKNAVQRERELLIEIQNLKLSQLQAATEFEIAQTQRSIDKRLELQTIGAQEEKDLIKDIETSRLAVLQAEEEAIKARGKLTAEENDRLKAIANERVTIAQETDDAIVASTARRIEETKNLSAQELELQRTKLANYQLESEAQDKLDAQAEAEGQREQDRADDNLNNFKNIQAKRDIALKNLEKNNERQIASLERQAQIQLDSIEIEKQSLQIELDSLAAKEKSVGLTLEEQRQVEILKGQVETLGQSAENVELNLKIDKDEVAAGAEAAKKEIQSSFSAENLAKIADPIGSTLKDALIKGLGITSEEAGAIIDGFSQLTDQVLELTSEIFAMQSEAIQEQIDGVTSQLEEAQTLADQVESDISETQTNIQALEDRIAQSRGANSDALIAQLDAQKKKEKELLKQKEDTAKKEKELLLKKQQLEAEKVEKDKAQAKLEIAIDIAKAFAQGAIGVAQAATVPFPANIAAIIATAAAVTSAVVGIIKFTNLRKGGIVKANRGTLLSGPSHENGGIPIAVNGRQVVEAEGGEIVLTRGVANDPALFSIASQLNQAGGGVPLMPKFADGGFLASQASNEILKQANAGLSTQDLQAAFIAGASSIRPVVSVTQIREQAATVDVIQAKSSF